MSMVVHIITHHVTCFLFFWRCIFTQHVTSLYNYSIYYTNLRTYAETKMQGLSRTNPAFENIRGVEFQEKNSRTSKEFQRWVETVLNRYNEWSFYASDMMPLVTSLSVFCGSTDRSGTDSIVMEPSMEAYPWDTRSMVAPSGPGKHPTAAAAAALASVECSLRRQMWQFQPASRPIFSENTYATTLTIKRNSIT